MPLLPFTTANPSSILPVPVPVPVPGSVLSGVATPLAILPADADLGEIADPTLIIRIRRGDQAAMAALFDRYGSSVYAEAMRVLGDPIRAEDVMQSIFLQVWKSPDRLATDGLLLGAWLSVMAKFRATQLSADGSGMASASGSTRQN